MSILKRIKSLIPKGFLWRLTLLNTLVIALAIAVSGWAVYNTACFLVEGMGSLDDQGQQQFDATLLQYLWIFSLISIIVGSVFHFYVTRKLINPIRQLIDSTKKMKTGEYPDQIETVSQDEVGELVKQYNSLIQQLKTNEAQRQKLVSDLSHEFRTPLANLNGYLHALQSGVVEGDVSLYQSLYQESNRLTLMVEQLEQLKKWDDIAEQTIGIRETMDIKEQINQCVAMFEWRLKQYDIPIEVDSETKVLAIHREGIQQVLSNLLDNAIRYYEGSGKIVVQGKLQESAYRISVMGPSKHIPESERNNIFERFYRLDMSRSRETGGTGLGLSIAKEIVEQHRGEIGVKQVGDNNLFWFTIPIK